MFNIFTPAMLPKMPSPVDWSEFNVWCFMVKDLQKIDLHKTLNASQNPAETLTVCATCVKERLKFPVAEKPPGGRPLMTVVPPRVGNGGVTTAHYVYAQFAAGALGGATATYSTHWLDTIKVKMQSFPTLYSSSTFCLRDTLKNEGVKGLYRGAVPAVAAQTSKTAVVFTCYGLCEELVRKCVGVEEVQDLSVWHHASAGAMTGVAASFVLCPLELIKCRLQALQEVTIKAPNGRVILSSCPTSMFRDILHLEGVRGLYRALPGIWFKEVPGSFIYFGSYETAKSFMKHISYTDHLSSRSVFVCGVLAGLCYCVTHPVESVKTRVQVMSAVAEYRGFFSAFVHILKTEGIAPLCSGLKPSMLRACVYSGIQFVIFENAKDFFLRTNSQEGK